MAYVITIAASLTLIIASRLCGKLLGPFGRPAYGIPPVIWWNNMERAMLAVDDVGCRDLLVRH